MTNQLAETKRRRTAIAFALAGTVLPVAGFHKFYLRQHGWGVLYILLSFTPIPRIASAIEAAWYATQDLPEFNRRFNGVITVPASPVDNSSQDVEAIAAALRHLDQLRTDGLISEQEFEQKRRQLVDRIA